MPSVPPTFDAGCYGSCQAADVPIVKLNPLNILTVKAEGEKELREVSFKFAFFHQGVLLSQYYFNYVHPRRQGRGQERAKRGGYSPPCPVVSVVFIPSVAFVVLGGLSSGATLRAHITGQIALIFRQSPLSSIRYQVLRT